MQKILLILGGVIERHHYSQSSEILAQLLRDNGYDVMAASDPKAMLTLAAGGYAGVVSFTDGDFFDNASADALVSFVQNGGGLVALHTAAFTNRAHEAYVKMIGAINTAGVIAPHKVQVSDSKHPIAEGIKEFIIDDELYVFESKAEYRTFLTTDYQGRPQPIAWSRNEGQGKVVYLTNGHAIAGLRHPEWQKVFLKSVKFVCPV